jgi:hypothetical protein
MSIHIAESGEAVAIYKHVKMLKVALDMVEREGKSKAVFDEIQMQINDAQKRLESADGRIFMDASGKFEFMQMAALHIESIEQNLANN